MKRQWSKYFDAFKVIVFLMLAAYLIILGDRYHNMSDNLRYFMAGALIVYALYKVFWSRLFRPRNSD